MWNHIRIYLLGSEHQNFIKLIKDQYPDWFDFVIEPNST